MMPWGVDHLEDAKNLIESMGCEVTYDAVRRWSRAKQEGSDKPL